MSYWSRWCYGLCLSFKPLFALLMAFRECEVLDLGTASRKGGKRSRSDCSDGIDHVTRGKLRGAVATTGDIQVADSRWRKEGRDGDWRRARAAMGGERENLRLRRAYSHNTPSTSSSPVFNVPPHSTALPGPQADDGHLWPRGPSRSPARTRQNTRVDTLHALLYPANIRLPPGR